VLKNGTETLVAGNFGMAQFVVNRWWSHAATPMHFRRVTQKIAFRLFLLIATVQTLILLGLTYAVVQVQEENSMANTLESATRLSDVIARSTRYSMLLNRKEDVQNIIASVGGEQGIDGIRVYNKQGEVVFGTTASDLRSKVDMNAEACVVCHTTPELETPTQLKGERYRIFTNPLGSRVVGLITPIPNEAQCSNADCHAHPVNKTILGVLDVKMSLADVDRQLSEEKRHLFLLSLGAVILIGVAAGGFIWLFVRRPVRRLIAGMEMVADGNLDHRLEAMSNDELGQMAHTFNNMTADLARARREITAWSATLEEKVREKTADLELAHKQMVRVEKMASLGNLASSVAHELNNPLEGILTFAKLLRKRIAKTSLPPDDIASYQSELKLIADEALRCGNIVKNLLVFARQRGSRFSVVRFRDILSRSVMLVNHHAEMNNVQIRTDCTDDDALECDPEQIEQVLVALMVNAIEAMAPGRDTPGSGLIGIDVRWQPKNDALVLRVSDNGMGMNDDIKAHIFEPFFTTKSEGKGVGLGLAITFGIIQRHHGTVDVESAPGQGTTFTITLPTKQPAATEEHVVSPTAEGAHE